MINHPTTEWYQDSSTMLKHRRTDRSHTCRPPNTFSDLTHQTAQEGTGSNGYRGTGPSERVGSVNDRSSHHRVVSGQLHNAQTLANRSLSHVQTIKYVLDLTHQMTAQEGTGSNGYRGTGPSERVGSVNGQSSHHRVVSGQLHDAQTPANRPLPHV